MAALYNDVLGRLEWDEQLGCWQGSIDWANGLVVEVSIEPGEDEEPAVYLARAVRAVDWLRQDERQAREAVAAEMLPVYNDSWSDEGAISHDEFMRRIEVMALDVPAEGGPLLWYDAGEMFGGHSIVAAFDEQMAFQDANLVG